jgi:short-subunit dehydrogenase
LTDSERRAALVTGGSSGIGLAVALMLADEGYALTIASRRKPKLEGAAEILRARGATVNFVAADFSDSDEACTVVGNHEAYYGRLDVLVQSAGTGFYGKIVDHRPRWLDLEIQINFRTPYLVLQRSLTMLTKAGAEHGKALVVNIASFNGVNPAANLASYSATKSALIAMSRAAQAELGSLGIQVTALCPGYVDTPMSDFWSEQVAKGEMLRADDLAEAVRFLLRTSPACHVPEIVLARGGGEL